MERVSQLQVKFTSAPYVFLQKFKEHAPYSAHFWFNPHRKHGTLEYNLEPVASGPYKFASFAKRKDGFINNIVS